MGEDVGIAAEGAGSLLVAALVVVLGVQAALLVGGDRWRAVGRRARARLPRVGTAVVVGGILRLVWVVWATRAPTQLRDPAEYLRIATDLGDGILPRFAGLDHSAYWPPGYPAVLAPFLWLAEQTGVASPAFTAALVNAAAGTVTVALTALVARRWIGPRAVRPAAWLVALCPALIYWTATAHTETVFTTVLLALVILASRVADHPSTRGWVLVGLLFGAAFLIRSPALVALAVPPLALRAGGASWRSAGRATGVVVASSLVLLVPWMIRNGTQVGVWSPASTNNAAAACFGHHDEAEASWEASLASPELQQDCYGDGSPFDDERLAAVYAETGSGGQQEFSGPDEPRWYRETMLDAVSWAITHPVEEVGLSVGKVWQTWAFEGRVVDGARNYAEPRWAGRAHDPLGLAAVGWTWVVGVAALVALVVVPACRKATVVWVPVVLYTLAIVGGIAEPHYRYPVVPLVAVLAAGLAERRRAPA